MRFEQLNEGVWAMTYLVVDESTKQAALVDPVYDFMQQYVDLLAHEDLTLVYVIATHTHADHITCLLYTSPSPRDVNRSRMPSSA